MDAQHLATQIILTLVREGYTAYFAGGWVRDYLMGHPSDDIDIATDAPPETIVALFPRTLLVGLAFGIVIVVMHGHKFEVATFRRDIDYADGRKPGRIELSTPEEDAMRRDFTINGMFYDPLEKVVHDYVQGAEDVKKGVIRAIGNPDERFVEDRLRMIRAVRFAARFGFSIDSATQDAVINNADTLFPAVAIERVWNELCKMTKYPRFDAAIITMHRLGLLPVIFPVLRGTHLDDIKKRVACYPLFPEGIDTILRLIVLFPEITQDGVVELCNYLHVSNADAALAAYYVDLAQLIQRESFYVRAEKQQDIDICAWVHRYAHPAYQKCLQVIASTFSADKRILLLEIHRQRFHAVEPHVQRIVQKTALVDASVLMSYGIKPGKSMGQLIKEAEKIAIFHDLHSSKDVMDILRKYHDTTNNECTTPPRQTPS